MKINYMKCIDQNDLSIKVAIKIISLINKKPNAKLILPTGSTPELTYEKIKQDFNQNHTNWSKVITCNLDEYVNLDEKHPKSYHYFMNEILFNKINIKRENTHIPNGIGDANKNALDYEQLVEKLAPFDLAILGVGVNGHIAFNEPNSDFNGKTSVVKLTESTINANKRFFNSEHEVPKEAITMGIGTILNCSKEIILLAFGKEKEQAIKTLKMGIEDISWPLTALLRHNNVSIYYTDMDL